MAAPVNESSVVSSENSNTTTHTVSLPSGIVTGELILVFISDMTVDMATPTGYTLFFGPADYSPQASPERQLNGWWRESDGGEGSTQDFLSTTSAKSAHNAYRISGAEDPDTQPPEASSGAFSDTNTSPDPDAITPTGGSKDYLFIAVEGQQNKAVSAAPTNYANLLTIRTGNPSANCQMGSASRALTAASEDPGTFTMNQDRRWAAFTVAVHPAGAAPAALVIPRQQLTTVRM